MLRLPLLAKEQKENETDSPKQAMCVLTILLIIESLTKNFGLLCLKRTYSSFVISHVKHSWKARTLKITNPSTYLGILLLKLFIPILILDLKLFNAVLCSGQIALRYLFNSVLNNSTIRLLAQCFRKISLSIWNNPRMPLFSVEEVSYLSHQTF